MQKGKLIIAGLMLTLSPAIYAAETAEVKPAEQIVEGQAAVTAEIAASPMQNHVVQLMEKDFSFETQYRELNNQLALEKLRSELRKLRGGNAASVPAPATPLTAAESDITDEPAEAGAAAPALRALLISEIAGQKRVAISGEGGGVKMVPLNKRFSYGGYEYIAHHRQGDDVTVEVISQ
ncbi:hypothetical protein [Enterobacter sp.]|uniref:hypothetical protein n=1 Tax=Enterobacter sp. TaxID=42895 RepID=UPI00296F3C40|nr:hypothetical protein [Enterobacter sp.]